MHATTARAVGSTLLTFAALAAGLAGCGAPAPTAIDAPEAPAFVHAAAATSQAPNARRLTGECATTFPAPQLPLPPVLNQEDRGTCQLSQLGRSDLLSAKEIDFAAGTQTITALVLTAANGDVLRGVGVGSNVPGPGRVRFTATMTFTGGTGRFANASGRAHVEGVANLVSRTSTFTIDGWVAYDASDRSDR